MTKSKPIKKQPVERGAWENQPCIIIASGPSLGFENYADLHTAKLSGFKSIAVNNSWEKAKFADVIYAGDGVWWKYNHSKIDIKAERWTCARSSTHLYGCKYRARFVKPGYNSGANAAELAANVFKANPVLLLGFDCSVRYGIHHHGKHKHSSNPSKDRTARWKAQFKSLRERAKDTRIINCSRYTEITQFERMPLQQAIDEIKNGLA